VSGQAKRQNRQPQKRTEYQHVLAAGRDPWCDLFSGFFPVTVAAVGTDRKIGARSPAKFGLFPSFDQIGCP
jgi:hypothetical protein